MTSKERVLRTLEFRVPDKIPMDLWVLPATRMHYGSSFDEVVSQYELDIASFSGPLDHAFTPAYYEVGAYVDPWGSVWNNIQAGVIGEVKQPVLEDYDNLVGYTAPTQQFLKEWTAYKPQLQAEIAEARAQGKFILGGWVSLFERMQYLRGTENLYCDIALEEPEMFDMIRIVMEFIHVYVDCWLELDIDAMPFGDDWGTQISLLISPQSWSKLFKPLYKQLIDKMKAAGKKVFFHSDGYIFDLYPALIELGVDAVNSQLWCMGVEKVAAQFAGKITFWGEISRQSTLPNGTPAEVLECAAQMKRALHVNGGLIGQSEINRDVSLANVEALLTAWN